PLRGLRRAGRARRGPAGLAVTPLAGLQPPGRPGNDLDRGRPGCRCGPVSPHTRAARAENFADPGAAVGETPRASSQGSRHQPAGGPPAVQGAPTLLRGRGAGGAREHPPAAFVSGPLTGRPGEEAGGAGLRSIAWEERPEERVAHGGVALEVDE